LEKIRFTVGLDCLYEIIESPNFSQANDICPVLVRLGAKYEHKVVVQNEETILRSPRDDDHANSSHEESHRSTADMDRYLL
jgi:hypothetical protein